jgi:gentisate 1,2-dioxygenase
MTYVNPATGGSAMQTIGPAMQQLRPFFTVTMPLAAPRHDRERDLRFSGIAQ